MSIRSDVIWMDGEFVPYDQAQIHVLAHTLHYGMGAFEGIRCYPQPDGRGGVFRLGPHLRRLFDSVAMCRMQMPFDYDTVHAACLETLRRNGMTDAYIRPVVFYGSGTMGLGARDNQVHVVIAVWKWGAYLGEEGLQNGIRCGISSFVRPAPNATLQRAKVIGQYTNSILARYEANDNGFEEAIMLDGNGYVAEGTGENLFVIRDGVVRTPPVANILGGVTRGAAMDILRREGVEVQESFFGRDGLYAADEIFMTGTAAEITPVREIDHRTIGAGKPGPITKRVQEIYLSGVRGQVDWMREGITLV